jgi:hypothetical protein
MLFDIFNGHHERVQKHERGELKAVKKSAEAELSITGHQPHPPHERDGRGERALAATPFAAYFAKPEVIGTSNRSSASTRPTPCTSSEAGIVTGLPRRGPNPWPASPPQCWRRSSATS